MGQYPTTDDEWCQTELGDNWTAVEDAGNDHVAVCELPSGDLEVVEKTINLTSRST